MLNGGEPISVGRRTIADRVGSGQPNAAAGDQRWFGAPGLGMYYLMLNPARGAFSEDPAVRRAVSLALDRAALSADLGHERRATGLLPPSVPGSDAAAADRHPRPTSMPLEPC